MAELYFKATYDQLPASAIYGPFATQEEYDLAVQELKQAHETSLRIESVLENATHKTVLMVCAEQNEAGVIVDFIHYTDGSKIAK